jgi:hypothetical protein
MKSLEPVSMLEQTVDALQNDADRLRSAHVRVRNGSWKEPLAEPEDVLLQAAEKVERFRLTLLRFARQCGQPVRRTRELDLD